MIQDQHEQDAMNIANAVCLLAVVVLVLGMGLPEPLCEAIRNMFSWQV